MPKGKKQQQPAKKEEEHVDPAWMRKKKEAEHALRARKYAKPKTKWGKYEDEDIHKLATYIANKRVGKNYKK